MEENPSLSKILYEKNLKSVEIHFQYSMLMQFVGLMGALCLLTMIAIFVIPHETVIIIVSGLFISLLSFTYGLANWRLSNYKKILRTLSR